MKKSNTSLPLITCSETVLSVIFLLIVIIIPYRILRAQSEEFRFKRISTSNTLSFSSIADILQDSRGFLWFATAHGLHRWDGYKIKSFYHDPEDTNSLSFSSIVSIYEDTDSILWVGTYRRGLNKLNRNLENFTQYDVEHSNPDANNQYIIWEMCEDQYNNLWIGTSYGLLKFNRTTGRFKTFLLDSTSFYKEVSERAINNIRAICNMDDNTLLLGTTDGLVQFDLKNEIFIESPFNELGLNKYQDLYSDDIRDIYRERLGVYWIATMGGGLYRYEPQKNLVQSYLAILNKTGNTNSGGVNSISGNGAGNLWIGTIYGLHRYDESRNKFDAYLHNSRDATSISSSAINKVYIDKADNLWVGTSDRGVSLLPNRRKPYKLYDWDSEDSNSLGHGLVKSICEDKNGHIWIGTWGGGVSHYNPEKRIFTRYTSTSPRKRRIRSNYINVIYQDGDEDIWIGSAGIEIWDLKKGFVRSIDELNTRRIRTICESTNGNLWIGFKYSGFAQYNKSEDSFSYFFHKTGDSLSLSDDRIVCIYEDSSGRLWIGTLDGLNRLDYPRSEQPEFRRYYHDPANPNSVSDNTINAIYEDSKGRMWIGTQRGLDLFDINTNRFIAVNIIEGSTNNIIQKIIEDDHGNLWIRWGENLVRYNPDTGDTRVYDERDEFIPEGQHGRFDQVLYRGKSGTMYYGGVNRFVTFDPDRLEDNPNPPPIVITNFLFHNKPVDIAKDSPLKGSIIETKLIELPYDGNILSFEFAALDFTNPSKNQYAYKMTGVDDEWVYTDATRRYANYTNLDPGEYIFTVKASNSDGIWNEKGTSIRIIINPPWWKTWWAYSFYVLFFLGLIYSLRRYEMNRVRLRNQVKIEEAKRKEREQVDQMKSTFFTNISHEFRTPLTLILGPLTKLAASESDENKKHNLRIMQRNAGRLLRLINQLLDFSKLESGKMNLQASEGDIVSFVKGLLMSFQSLAEQKHINYHFASDQRLIELYFDRDKAEKIFTNLISNAFKFTPTHGEITVSIAKNEHDVRIGVKDTGQGISAEKLPHILDRFYQADDSLTRNQGGTGIGLALTKELVELHHGTIEVTSKPNHGSEFLITLPTGRSHLTEDQIVAEDFILSEEPTTPIEPAEAFEASQTKDLQKTDSETIVLVVEDNADMRSYIRETLYPAYKVVEAFDGVEGVECAMEIIPDLIISDLMMPKKDGYQLCNEIKQDEATSHIPVILLTAKAERKDKLAGLELGADDYLIKPFDSQELQIRVKNLIEIRRKLQAAFKDSKVSFREEKLLSPVDQRFLERVMAIISDKLADEHFDVKQFSYKIGMSGTQLRRKMNALTGQSPNQFIRSMRLKEAARLIREEQQTVSEAAYLTGFNSLSYFSKCFKEEFGRAPSEY
jgi:signal transduction histidine kinase/ligand-binding sensor domain-containing protein/AraC-like DNA-binding protein